MRSAARGVSAAYGACRWPAQTSSRGLGQLALAADSPGPAGPPTTQAPAPASRAWHYGPFGPHLTRTLQQASGPSHVLALATANAHLLGPGHRATCLRVLAGMAARGHTGCLGHPAFHRLVAMARPRLMTPREVGEAARALGALGVTDTGVVAQYCYQLQVRAPTLTAGETTAGLRALHVWAMQPAAPPQLSAAVDALLGRATVLLPSLPPPALLPLASALLACASLSQHASTLGQALHAAVARHAQSLRVDAVVGLLRALQRWPVSGTTQLQGWLAELLGSMVVPATVATACVGLQAVGPAQQQHVLGAIARAVQADPSALGPRDLRVVAGALQTHQWVDPHCWHALRRRARQLVAAGQATQPADERQQPAHGGATIPSTGTKPMPGVLELLPAWPLDQQAREAATLALLQGTTLTSLPAQTLAGLAVALLTDRPLPRNTTPLVRAMAHAAAARGRRAGDEGAALQLLHVATRLAVRGPPVDELMGRLLDHGRTQGKVRRLIGQASPGQLQLWVEMAVRHKPTAGWGPGPVQWARALDAGPGHWYYGRLGGLLGALEDQVARQAAHMDPPMLVDIAKVLASHHSHWLACHPHYRAMGMHPPVPPRATTSCCFNAMARALLAARLMDPPILASVIWAWGPQVAEDGGRLGASKCNDTQRLVEAAIRGLQLASSKDSLAGPFEWLVLIGQGLRGVTGAEQVRERIRREGQERRGQATRAQWKALVKATHPTVQGGA